MKVVVEHDGRQYAADLHNGIDLSIPFAEGQGKVNAYYAEPVAITPFQQNNWVGEVAQGASVNYRNISFNPHGNGTHTECVGHIDRTIHSVNRHIRQFHLFTRLITVTPIEKPDGDQMVEKRQLESFELEGVEAVIVRTLPNDRNKRTRNHSGRNAPYFHYQAVKHLVDMGCKHLVLDLPSIDKESDDGKLLGHRAFWNYPDAPRMDCSVTELAYIPDRATDGLYLLNLQIAPFENDAAPSRPVIFPLTPKG